MGMLAGRIWRDDRFDTSLGEFLAHLDRLWCELVKTEYLGLEKR
jgi:hypothetical protein